MNRVKPKQLQTGFQSYIPSREAEVFRTKEKKEIAIKEESDQVEEKTS